MSSNFKIQNIDKIKKENIIKEPFEHIIIEDFVLNLHDTYLFKQYLKTMEDLSDDSYKNDGPRYVSPYFNLLELIKDSEKEFTDAINEVWGVNVDGINCVNNMISRGQNLHIHNDYYGKHETPNNPPVRGIIYCNPKYTFGTNIYDHDEHNECIPESMQTVGGKPGTLFLFKVSETSWHSAVNPDGKLNRLIVSLQAVNRKKLSGMIPA